MKMIRKFHPVGQGAFYSEEFIGDDGNVVFRVVYDCGCINRREEMDHGRYVVKDAIKGWIGPHGKRIDCLFISHFDFDHVSLLQVLVNEKVEVGVVVLPLLHGNDKEFHVQLFRRSYENSAADFLSRLIENPRGVFSPDTSIVLIAAKAAGAEVRHHENDAPEKRIHFTELKKGSFKEVQSGTMFIVGEDTTMGGDDWCYVPRNLECKADLSILEEQFDHIKPLTSVVGFEELMRKWTGRSFGLLKKIYERFPGGINVNSMVVYSGPAKSDPQWFLHPFFRRECKKAFQCLNPALVCVAKNCSSECSYKVCRPGCIFTGDVSLKLFKIKVEFGSRIVGNVGTIQVPHHGSEGSFSIDVFGDGYYICPISCSNESYYGHPDASVTNQLVSCGSFPIRVTETQGFEQLLYKF